MVEWRVVILDRFRKRDRCNSLWEALLILPDHYDLIDIGTQAFFINIEFIFNVTRSCLKAAQALKVNYWFGEHQKIVHWTVWYAVY